MKHVLSFLLIVSTTISIAQENCNPNIDTLNISTGLHGLTALALADYSLDPLWYLTQAPPDPQGWTSNIGGPAIVIPASASWQYAGTPSKYLNAYPTNQALTDNWALSTNEYIYERNFCLCGFPEGTDSVEVTIHLALNADNWAEVELVDPVSNGSMVLSQPYVYSTSNFVGAPDSITFTTMLSEGDHQLRIHHRNKQVVMGVNLHGWVASEYVLPNTQCSETGPVAGFMYEDANNDQMRSIDDPGIRGVEVNLLDQNLEVYATTTSDDAGYYFFMNVPEGGYTVEANAPDGWSVADEENTQIEVDVNASSITRHDVELVSWTVGLSQASDHSFSLSTYPNPSEGIVNITLNGNIEGSTRISLVDLSGRTLKSFILNKDQRQLSIDGLSGGLYFIQAEQSGEVLTERLIVK